MQTVEALNPSELQFGTRAVLVGSARVPHDYKDRTVTTEVIVVLKGSFSDSLPSGEVDCEVSFGYGVSHSNRDQGAFVRERLRLPPTITVGTELELKVRTVDHSVTVASITTW